MCLATGCPVEEYEATKDVPEVVLVKECSADAEESGWEKEGWDKCTVAEGIVCVALRERCDV